jgi:hypothetical protein
MQVLPDMPREMCQSLKPLYEIFATIISHHCFDGQRFEVILLPSEASDFVACANRDDVKSCWFNGNQSMFFDVVLEPERLEKVAGKMRAINLVGTNSEPGNFFIRQSESKTQVNQLGSLRVIEAADQQQLAVTLRDRSLMFSIVVSSGSDCEYRLTDASFEEVLSSFDFQPPFTPTVAARNGCFLFLADHSVPQSTLDAVARRISPIPGRQITIDVWLQQIGEEVIAKLPLTMEASSDDEAARSSLHAIGLTIASEFPTNVNVTMHGCDSMLQSQIELTVTERD